MNGPALELEFEITPAERSGAGRARALAAAATAGAGLLVVPATGPEPALRELLAAARAAKLRVVLAVHGRAPEGGCPNDAATLVESAARIARAAAIGADALELAAFGFPEGDPAAPPAARFLATLCHCAGCLRRLAARGLDGAKLLSKARGLSGAASQAAGGGVPLTRPEEIGPWLVKQLGARESAALLATRKESLAAMTQELRKHLVAGTVLRARAHPSPFVGGERFGGGLLALSDWLDGFTIDAPPAPPGAAMPDAATLAAAVKSARSAALPESRFTVRLAAPAADAAATLSPLARASRKEGAAALRLVSDGSADSGTAAAWKSALAGTLGG
jgi:hypothetical protein